MNGHPSDADHTRVFRPGLASAFGNSTARTETGGGQIDAQQIRTLGAINPLVAAANPLLMALPSLRTASPPGDVGALRLRLLDLLKDFDAACTRQGVADEHRHLARYALCTVLDEAIQRTPWGGTANWAQQSLLIHGFKENWGGEKFFQILDKMMQSPDRYAALLDLFAICLALGFMGRYLLTDAAGRQAVAELRERLHQQIRQGKPPVEPSLSARWEGVSVASRRFKGFTALGLAVGSMALLGLGLFVYLSYALADQRLHLGLDQLALKVPPLVPAASVTTPLAVAPPVAALPRLGDLLKADVASGLLQVRDLPHESIVTLTGEKTFDSGSSSPTYAAVGLIDRVALVLDKLEGRVVVTGHTDNVPTRTLRFPSNFELSKERARNVASLIRLRLKDGSRVIDEGRGESEPVASNATAEGRARNRRVEITLRVPNTAQ